MARRCSKFAPPLFKLTPPFRDKMASAIYLESFFESIENLPKELQRNFSLMRDLDQRTQDIMKEAEQCTKEYKRTVASLSKEGRKEKICKIEELHQKAKEYSDDKVQLAMQLYEMIDKHIRRLDTDLTRFEQELQLKESTQRRASVASMDGQSSGQQSRARKRSLGEASSGTSRRKKHHSITDESGFQSISSPSGSGLGSNGTDIPMDMPVDPNEPTYCLCHQVSFGEMIGCDNNDCPIEWFHFQCVGLSSKPKGKWYCPRCSQEKNKKRV